MTIVQILAVDLGTDMLPALALGAESSDKKLMQQPPRPAKEKATAILARFNQSRIFMVGDVRALASLTVFFFVLHQSGWEYGNLLSKADLFSPAGDHRLSCCHRHGADHECVCVPAPAHVGVSNLKSAEIHYYG